ncbi:triose-phosphate isomerase [Candidatus Parcubacteria bacterium]|nr:triose-phosphate isomerase [Patescibacteria group bacterium]MCG2686682.1 triose-phosphate isomerase [Candidatus Parcubacteria bacterium]
MKKTYLIANWKMNLLNKQAEDLALEILDNVKNIENKNLEIVLCTSFTALDGVGEIIRDSDIKLGAQNVFYHNKGSYTGEVSSTQLKEQGVKYVIIGHSERRKYLNETDEDINKKIIIALENNLIPILCIGETMEERQDSKTDLVLIRQISKAMEDVELKDNQKLIIAYEPVWVIGTGQAVDIKEAEHSAQVTNQVLKDFFSQEIIKDNISIIYGGSVDADNINSFLEIDLISGALVGNASLLADNFLKIINKIYARTH